MRSSMFIAQLTTLWYRSANWLAGLRILVDTREYFRLTDFWVILYLKIFQLRTFIVSHFIWIWMITLHLMVTYFLPIFLPVYFYIYFTFLLSLSFIVVFVSLFSVAHLYFHSVCFHFHSVVFCWRGAIQTVLCLLNMRMGLRRKFDRVMLSHLCC
jgi:hypothetical protein